VAASFAAGVLAFGLNGGDARSVGASAGAAAGGCRERPLAHGVSADPPLPGRLAAVERVPVPRAGFYTAAAAPAADELLHAVVHGFAVVRYRGSDRAVGGLRRLVARKVRSFAVIATPGAPGAPALSGTVWGRELRCRALSPQAVRALERFVDALHGIP
jgi:hypothetical protein